MTKQYIITEEQLVVLKAAITMGALVIENGTVEEHEAFNKGFDTLQSLTELTWEPVMKDEVLLQQALEMCYHYIPSYAYSDNEAACDMASRLYAIEQMLYVTLAQPLQPKDQL